MAENPLTLKNGKWTVNNRMELWSELGPRIFNQHLDSFRKLAFAVLSEKDPKFELDKDKRFVASIYEKNLSYSPNLRNGIAESLALMGSYPHVFTNCTTGKPTEIAILTIQDILKDADWIIWASLGRLLPLLAEAAPCKFLDSIESSLDKTPCPFDILFAQEGDGTTGENYLSGILWALENLAWDEEYLVRVTVLLGDLALRDPGGTWANRPANSLATIFLPWLPQTKATSEKRILAIKTLTRENPDIGWKLILSLLPETHQRSMGSHKPKFRDTIPENWEAKVTDGQYWEQISEYAKLAAEMAQKDLNKLNGLIEHLDRLPPESIEEILKHIGSENIIQKTENERIILWTELKRLISKHKKYAEAQWALPSDLILKFETVTAKLAPQNLVNLHRRLFDDTEMGFEGKQDWQEQQDNIENQRQKAIEEILNYGGIKAVLHFAENVKHPYHVGFSMGLTVKAEADSTILPMYLEAKKDILKDFSKGFILGRFQSKGWLWVDNMDTKTWSKTQIALFLSTLPFTSDTWNRSKKLLKRNEIEYWRRANINSYQPDKLDLAINELIKYDRPIAAIDCLYALLKKKQPLDKELPFKVLLAAVSSREPTNQIVRYHTIKIIKALQDDPATNQDKLFQIEWAYLPYLTRHGGASPLTLEHRLASDPEFFCEIIRLVYRSKKEGTSKTQPSGKEKSLASNAYRLLHEWKKIPGSQPDGSISDNDFRHWIKEVKNISSKSGHLDVAMSHIGQVLINCPPDPEGLWIHCAVAKELNAKDAQRLRMGFKLGVLNSRGFHCIDPTGKEEMQLAEKFRNQSKAIENAAYHRLATTIKEIAEAYESEAQRVINRQTEKA